MATEVIHATSKTGLAPSFPGSMHGWELFLGYTDAGASGRGARQVNGPTQPSQLAADMAGGWGQAEVVTTRGKWRD
jgi:hypothetical protein